MWLRTLSGIIYVVLITGSLLAGKFVFGTVMLVVGALALHEFYRIMDGQHGTDLLHFSGIFTGVLMMLTSFLVFTGLLSWEWLAVIMLFFVGLWATGLFTVRDGGEKRLATAALGVLYIALPLSLLIILALQPWAGYAYKPWVVLGIFILIWVNDIMAYLVGITMGRHRLFERVSPKKSWEGAIGGAVLTLFAAIWMNDLMPVMTQRNWLVLAGIVSVFGVLGDLFESMCKRSADMKDSGRIMPGHGGILDRIDSLLFVVPVAFVYLLFENL